MPELVSRSLYARRLRHYLAFNHNYSKLRQPLSEIRKTVDSEIFPPFAWPGGYPVIYIDSNGDELCAKCARLFVLYDGFDPSRDDDVPFSEICKTNTIVADIYYEGDPIECAACNITIESAYGPIRDLSAEVEYDSIDGIEAHAYNVPRRARNGVSVNDGDDEIPF